MPPKVEEKVRVAVPTGGRRRLRIGLRDVGITLAIAALILGVLYAFNRPVGNGEGSFQKVAHYTGGIPTGAAPVKGQPAPDFEIPLLGGGTFRLSDYKGKVVWINFWASWCPPCRAETPDIVKVWNEQKDGDLVILGADFGEDASTAKAFADKTGMTYPIGLDPRGVLATEYRLAGLPSHFFVDRNGILREIRIGLLSEASMRQTLDRLRSY
ncbi:MAG: TlpA disulfide reductase family protein [Chloroflexota bacterium]|nr:TlpA disulfide reductase family protein [Chloroflexota bacterium]